MGHLTITLFVLLTSLYSPSQPRETSVDEQLEALLRQGKTRLAENDLVGALEVFESAEAIELHEAPNYRPTLWLAEVRCRLGDVQGGRSLLADFECMLDVDAGDLSCYVGRPTSAAPGQPNYRLTPRCFLEMCGEVLLGYYEQPSEAQLAHIGELRGEAARIRSMCVAER